MRLGAAPGEDRAKDVVHLAGVGCTAALATDRSRRGPHRVHVSGQTATATWTASLELTKGHRSRAEEERLAAALVLGQVAAACGLSAPLPLELTGEEDVRIIRTAARPDWTELLLGNIDATCEGANAPSSGDDHSSGLVFPGAFHPLHEGHHRMAEVAQARLGRRVEFELSMENVDKPPLDFTEIARRLEQFAPNQPVWLTRAPTFLAKSQLFPGATFVVGADTIVRIADPAYYGGSEAACRAAIAEIARRGCRFLVFGRLMHDSFQTLSGLNLTSDLHALCAEIPAHEYRLDISSTQIRRSRK
jgi:nicotinic acid mononucleotide adenylyltransferase